MAKDVSASVLHSVGAGEGDALRTLIVVTWMAAVALQCSAARSAGLYRCVDAHGAIAYEQQACPGADTAAMPVDRALARDSAAPPGTSQRVAPPSGHRLTTAERQRIARRRGEEPELSAEARTAAEIEIAAMREGVDANISAADRARLEALRVQLAAADPGTRADALATWRTLYARYRTPAHPRVQPAAPVIGSGESVPRAIPEPPLGTPIPGTRGPLVATPGEAAGTGLPSRAGPVADPASGRVLAPAGNDRLIDPMTGTIWMRSGRVYVDPSTGRIIPAP